MQKLYCYFSIREYRNGGTDESNKLTQKNKIGTTDARHDNGELEVRKNFGILFMLWCCKTTANDTNSSYTLRYTKIKARTFFLSNLSI